MKKVRVYEWHECFYVIYVNIDDLPCRWLSTLKNDKNPGRVCSVVWIIQQKSI
jgi:hypothetical protein